MVLDLLCVGILGATLYALSVGRSAGAIESKLNLVRGFALFSVMTLCGAVGHAILIGRGCLTSDGSLIAVSAGTTAQQVGLRAGDKLVSLNSRPVTGWDALLTRLEVPSSKSTRIEVLRSSLPISIEIPSLTSVSSSYEFGMQLPIERHPAQSFTAGVQDAVGAFRTIGGVLLGRHETVESGLHPDVAFLDLLLTYAITIIVLSPVIISIVAVMRCLLNFGSGAAVFEGMKHSGGAESISDIVPYGGPAHRGICGAVGLLPDVYRSLVVNTAGGLVLSGGFMDSTVGEERGS